MRTTLASGDTVHRCPTCKAGLRRPQETGRHACEACLRRLRDWLLAELPEQLDALRRSVVRDSTGGGPRVSTSPAAHIPGREDVLSLLGPFAPMDRIPDPDGDQAGPLPLRGTLYRWVRRVRASRDLTGPATQREEELAAWLAEQVAWCAEHEWITELYADLDSMMRTIRGITRLTPRRRPIAQPCPRCAVLGLVEEDWQTFRECTACGTRYSREELRLGAAAWLARNTAEGTDGAGAPRSARSAARVDTAARGSE